MAWLAAARASATASAIDTRDQGLRSSRLVQIHRLEGQGDVCWDEGVSLGIRELFEQLIEREDIWRGQVIDRRHQAGFSGVGSLRFAGVVRLFLFTVHVVLDQDASEFGQSRNGR